MTSADKKINGPLDVNFIDIVKPINKDIMKKNIIE
jgi:hypothetical protein